MAVAIVNYLLQQGYAPNQMVILTPYLGQLMELQRLLRDAALSVTMNEQVAR
jgi:hypothetical protein